MVGGVRLGVLGGTFDPPHNAHLAVAEAVLERLGLSEVLFVPAGQPQLKAGEVLTPKECRVEMTALAISGRPKFRLSTIEIERPGPTYTVDTIAELRRQRAEDALFFIMGWDNVSTLPLWHEPQRLVSLCKLVVVPRPGFSRPDPAALETLIPGLAQRVVLMRRPEMDISSSDIRERVAKGLPISHLVPPVIEAYIKEKGLYRGP